MESLTSNLDYACVFVVPALSGESGMFRWRQIKGFEQIAPDREATGDLPNRIAIGIGRTRASGAPRLNAIKPDGYWRLFHH
jgi:hypothetical protein